MTKDANTAWMGSFFTYISIQLVPASLSLSLSQGYIKLKTISVCFLTPLPIFDLSFLTLLRRLWFAVVGTSPAPFKLVFMHLKFFWFPSLQTQQREIVQSLWLFKAFCFSHFFLFIETFPAFSKEWMELSVSKFCPNKFISLKFEQPAIYQYTSLHFIFLKRVSTLKHYQNLSLKKSFNNIYTVG